MEQGDKDNLQSGMIAGLVLANILVILKLRNHGTRLDSAEERDSEFSKQLEEFRNKRGG